MTSQSEETSLRDALAIAIVKERREMARDVERWRNRALAAEEELSTLKASLQGNSSCDTLLSNLAELNALIDETTSPSDSDTLELQARRQTLALFLRNVHALRTAQMMRERGKIAVEVWKATTFDLICDFVTSALVRLSPGKLRTAYAQHATEFFTLLSKASHQSKTSEDHEQRLRDLIAILIDGVVGDVTSPGMEEWKNDAALEFLTCLFSLPFCLIGILHKTSDTILCQIQKIANSAIDLQKTNDDSSLPCEQFLQQSTDVWRRTQTLFQLQEKALEKLVHFFCCKSESVNFAADWVDPLIRSALHAQQYVEILEIFVPEMADAVYLSTAMIIAALQRIGSEEHMPSSHNSHQTACIERTKSIRDFYLPVPWSHTF